MFLFAMGFLIGDVYLQSFPHLPDKYLIDILMTLAMMILLIFPSWRRYLLIPCALLLGFSWSAWYGMSLLSYSLPKNGEGKVITVTGYVASLPVTDRWQTSFIFATDTTRFKLSWRNNTKKLIVGDQWKLNVRLKRIHSTQNPGTFDYEAWALQNGIRATGYVIEKSHHEWLSHSHYRYFVNQLRQKLQQRIQSASPNSKTAPWLMALMIGERQGILQESWQVLRNTGTNHLMAIGGLHIGIISGLAYAVVSWCWRRSSWLLLRCPAQIAGISAAFVMALFYSALAGFSIPTQRACLMLSIFTLSALLRRHTHLVQVWSLTLLIVLVWSPLSVLTESFWLSFGTIALIIYGMTGRIAPSGWWWKWGRVQWVIGIGLIPLTLLFFQQCSFSGFMANCIAIPWLGCCVLPLCFLSGIGLIVYPPMGHILLILADKSLSILWSILTWISQLPFTVWHIAIPSWKIFFLFLGGFLLLQLPRSFPGKWLGLFWLLPLLLFKPPVPLSGDYWMTLLDVGQGLALVVQTHAHTLVFDAGPKINDHLDTGENILVPYLYTRGIKNIDMLVVSHGDNDHIGGAMALRHSFSVAKIVTSVPEMLPSSETRTCLSGEGWDWDGVNFTFLYPTTDDLHLGNDASCVLRIDNGTDKVLLTGDIEKYAEKKLLEKPDQLSADVLVAPHHGSKTSGLKEFIAAVHPKFVLYAIGYRNRYHFPHLTVINAYAKIRATQLDTATSGAIAFQFTHKASFQSPELYRVVHKRYWLD